MRDGDEVECKNSVRGGKEIMIGGDSEGNYKWRLNGGRKSKSICFTTSLIDDCDM